MIVKSTDLTLRHDPAKHRLGARASLSECFRTGEIFASKQLELLERLERLEQAPLRCGFKAMEGLNAQVKRKILSDNPRRFYGI